MLKLGMHGKVPQLKCNFDQLASVNNAVAATVYQQMEQGIKHLLESGKKTKCK
jgi:hypothetical protein